MFFAISTVVYVCSVLAMLLIVLLFSIALIIFRSVHGYSLAFNNNIEEVKAELKVIAFNVFFPVLNTWNVFEFLFLLIFHPQSFKPLFTIP